MFTAAPPSLFIIHVPIFPYSSGHNVDKEGITLFFTQWVQHIKYGSLLLLKQRHFLLIWLDILSH